MARCKIIESGGATGRESSREVDSQEMALNSILADLHGPHDRVVRIESLDGKIIYTRAQIEQEHARRKAVKPA